MQEGAPQPDPFKPEMPCIPGVNDEATRKSGASLKRMVTIMATMAAIGLVVALHLTRSKSNAQASAPIAISEPLPPVSSDTVTAAPAVKEGPAVVATLAELSKPWSSKKFTFVNPATGAEVSAIIVRLPITAADRSSSYWAFSIATPYEGCALEYVTDPGEIASRSSYHAKHPVVLAPCDGTVYDPLQMATSPTGAFVRGEIVHGVGIRPPLEVEIRVQGDSIVASNVE
jgi:hypothetical protein